MKRRKKYVSLFLAVFLALASYLGKAYMVEASSVSWSLYYVSGGASSTQVVVSLPTYAGYYRAHCSGFNGNCTYKTINIKCYKNYNCTSSQGLSETVRFSTSGNVDFKLVPFANQTTMYYKVTLSYSGGTTASSTGYIKTL